MRNIIGILVPFGKEKEIYNLLQPLAIERKYNIYSSDMLARGFKTFFKKDSPLELNKMIISQMFFKLDLQEDCIYIGSIPKNVSVNYVIAYMPAFISAEEDYLSIKTNFKENFISADNTTRRIDAMSDLIGEVDKCINLINSNKQ